MYGFVSGGTTNYAVYGDVPSGFTAATGHYAGYFNGNIAAIGPLLPASDSKLKDNVQNIANANQIIRQITPKTFNYKTNDFPTMNLPGVMQYGLIAQEVEGIMPEVVSELTHPAKYDSAHNKIAEAISYKGINYNAFIPLLIKSHQ